MHFISSGGEPESPVHTMAGGVSQKVAGGALAKGDVGAALCGRLLRLTPRRSLRKHGKLMSGD